MTVNHEKLGKSTSTAAHALTNNSSNKNPFYIVTKNDLDILSNNHVAAAILSVMKNMHKWKIETDAHNKKMNDIAEAHGDRRWLSEDVCINLTVQEIQKRILNLGGRNSIMNALKLLEAKGLIKPEANPNPKYKYDNSRYFRFYEQRHIDLIRAHTDGVQIDDESEIEIEAEAEAEKETVLCKSKQVTDKQRQHVDSLEGLKLNVASSEIKLDQGVEFKNKRGAFKSKRYIKNSNKYINNNQSINKPEIIFDESEIEIQSHEKTGNETIKHIVDALIEKGMPANKFFPDVLSALEDLSVAGATQELLNQSYDIAERITKNGFGMNYVIKVAVDLLEKSKNNENKSKIRPVDNTQTNTSLCETSYENLFNRVPEWAQDLI